MAIKTIFDTRQSENRELLDQLSNNSTTLLKDLLESINSEFIPLVRLSASDPVDRTVLVSANIKTNPLTDRKTIQAPINGIIPDFTGGVVEFPALAGGTITVTPGDNETLTMPVSSFLKVGIFLRTDGEIVLTFGDPAATEATATVPPEASNAIAAGYAVVETDAGGNVLDISSEFIYQYSSTGGSSIALNQDRNLKLIAGGVWNYNQDGDLSWSEDAYIQIAGLQNDRNTIEPTSISISGTQAAYVVVNRNEGAADQLAVSVDDIENIPQDTNVVIIARGDGADKVLVGASGAFALKQGEYLEIDGALAEINRQLGTLRLEQDPTDNQIVNIATSIKDLLDGAVLRQEIGGRLINFTGGAINFDTGIVTGGMPDDDFIPLTIPVGEQAWYGVSLSPRDLTADELVNVSIQVTPGSGTDAINPPFPLIIGDKKLGAIKVQNNAGTVEVVEIIRLGVGSGGAGGGEGLLNYVENGQFETSATSWEVENDGDLSRETDNPLVGSGSLRIENTYSADRFTVTGSVLLIDEGYSEILLDATAIIKAPDTIDIGDYTIEVYNITDDETEAGTVIEIEPGRSHYAFPFIADLGKEYSIKIRDIDGTNGDVLLVDQVRIGPNPQFIIPEATEDSLGLVKKPKILLNIEEVEVSYPGEAGQIAAGHILTHDSFPADLDEADVSFYNLDNTDDSSSNSRDLTNLNSVTFNNADIFNNNRVISLNGTDQLLYSYDNAFFNAASNYVTAGAWIRLDSGAIGGTTKAIIAVYDYTGNQRRWDLQINTSGFIRTRISDDGTTGANLQTITTSFQAEEEKWYHVVGRFDLNENKFTLFINGFYHSEYDITIAGLHTGTAPFMIGAVGTETTNEDHFKGRIQDAFVVNELLPINSINKLASYRVELLDSAEIMDMHITSSITIGGTTQLISPFLYQTHITEENIYWDLTGLGEESIFSIRIRKLDL